MKKTVVLILLGFLSMAVNSAGIELTENKSISIVVGANDFSMLEILNRKISHVDVDFSKCEVATERSLETGKLLFKPASEQPFTVFVTDNHGDTYTVNVKVSLKKAPELFTLKNKKAEAMKAKILSAAEKYKESSVKAISFSEGHRQVSLDLIRAMELNDTPVNVDITIKNREIFFWNEAKLFEKKNYRTGEVVGVIYELMNTTEQTMILLEREFYNLNKNTISISIKQKKLKPKEATLFYVVYSMSGE